MQTQIPTLARAAVRALVKAHPDWLPFITARGKLSAQALNSELLEFALKHKALTAQIENVLNLSPVGAPVNGPETMADDTVEPVEPVVSGPYEFDAIVSSVDQFLSPVVRKELSTALGAVITAANRDPVEVAPGEGAARAAAAAAPKARRDKRIPFRALYPTKNKATHYDALVTLWTGAQSPSPDPFHVPDLHQMSILLTAFERGANTWLAGPSGSGKSTMPREAAARTGRPFTLIKMMKSTDTETLIGQVGVGAGGLANSGTVWQDGALIKAMRQPGMVILIDELTLAPPTVQAIILHVAGDDRSFTLPTGELVTAADGVVFVVADNTCGTGDEGGWYAGTNVSSVALVNRFARMIIVDYLSAKAEAEALANHTRCPMPAARHLADFVATMRRLPSMAAVVISLRQMVAFVQMVQDGFPSRDAFIATVSCRMPNAERATIETACDLAWCSTFESMVNGTPLPVAPVAPSTSAAAQAFGDKTF